MGTKIGASRPHLAEAEPTSRLTAAVRKVMPTSMAPSGRPEAFRASAPSSATRMPMFDWLNAAMKMAQQNDSTR